MQVYKSMITNYNNETLRDKFFETPMIRRIWAYIAPQMTIDDYFKDGSMSATISKSFGLIVKMMPERYNIEIISLQNLTSLHKY